ncbi:VanZ family protein [Streptomyces sp. PR69]|uniref:VanZ family protein n=1 Tax=Streptomyces sp. PR69 TaxID=2984950 RepID=UPI0022652E8D|nr:VanZ family protein [Streptomyces sp. PR69]
MFRTYLLPVQAAVTLFPLVVMLIMVPVAIHGYRRRGRAGGWPVVVFYSFVFYLIAALLQTVMPLPARTSAHCSAARYAETPQLEPFDFYARIASASGGDWSVSTLTGLTVTWTSVLNALLLLPLGMFLRYYLRQGLLPSSVLAFATSLFFEATQYTGLWFIYACPYRQFNVDDLILNTGGAVVGWLLAVPLTSFLPAINPDRERVRYGGRVTVTRRLVAFVTNLAGWLVTWVLATGLLAVITGSSTGRRYAFAVGSALGLVWFWLLPALFSADPGKRILLLRIVRTDTRPAGFLRITLRAWVAYTPLALLWLSAAQYTRDALFPTPFGRLLPYAAVLATAALWGWTPLMALLRRDSRAPHERISGTVTLAVSGRPRRSGSDAPPVPQQNASAAEQRHPDLVVRPLPDGHRMALHSESPKASGSEEPETPDRADAPGGV